MSKLGYIAVSCKNILLSNTLLVCFYAKLTTKSYRNIRVASKDNTMANTQIYLRRNWVILNKTSLALMFTSDILIYFSFIIKSFVFVFHNALFRFVSFRDRILILFLLRIFISKKFQIPLRIKWSSPKIHRRIQREQEDRTPLFGARL